MPGHRALPLGRRVPLHGYDHQQHVTQPRGHAAAAWSAPCRADPGCPAQSRSDNGDGLVHAALLCRADTRRRWSVPGADEMPGLSKETLNDQNHLHPLTLRRTAPARLILDNRLDRLSSARGCRWGATGKGDTRSLWYIGRRRHWQQPDAPTPDDGPPTGPLDRSRNQVRSAGPAGSRPARTGFSFQYTEAPALKFQGTEPLFPHSSVKCARGQCSGDATVRTSRAPSAPPSRIR